MRLWLAEKPDAARQLAKALGNGTPRAGYIELPNKDVVTWAIGHLLESYAPHDYNPDWKAWSLDHLPIMPAKFLRKPEASKRQQLEVIAKLVRQASEIVIATDAGREGEAIAWSILEYAGWKGPAKRFWTSSLNPKHMVTAVKQLIDDGEKKSLYVAARIRSAMDWADGVNYSRYYNLSCVSYGEGVLSIGRVQTATLALVVDRDLAIDNFKPSDFFELRARMRTAAGDLDLFHRPGQEDRIVDRSEADRLAHLCSGKDTRLKVETKSKKYSPPPPFSLPELQMAASSRWGWSAKQTLDVLQGL